MNFAGIPFQCLRILLSALFFCLGPGCSLEVDTIEEMCARLDTCYGGPSNCIAHNRDLIEKRTIAEGPCAEVMLAELPFRECVASAPQVGCTFEEVCQAEIFVFNAVHDWNGRACEEAIAAIE